MNKHSFTMIIDFARRTLENKTKVSFNDLRRANPNITATAENFFQALKEHSKIAPADLKFTAKNGVIDPNVITDLEIEKS